MTKRFTGVAMRALPMIAATLMGLAAAHASDNKIALIPGGPHPYFAPWEQAAADARGEALRIVASGIASGEMPDADKTYLAQLVASRTGIPAADAEKRVNDMLAAVENAKTQAKEAADAARKAASTTMLLGFLALVIGAFISAVAAALAGKLRDEDVPSTT